MNRSKIMVSESQLQSLILTTLGSQRDIRMFRNLVGSGFVGVPPTRLRRVTFGLAPGSADLIGFKTYVISAYDVGKKVAVFTSVEVKKPQGSVTGQNQIDWLMKVRDFGGIATICTNPDNALDIVSSWHPQ